LHFIDLAQCEGFATGLLTGGAKALPAGPEAMEVVMNEHVSGAEQQISSTGETPDSGIRRLDVERRVRA
jgi:hypothetical protein